MDKCRISTISHKEGWDISKMWGQVDGWQAREKYGTGGWMD